MYIPKYNRQDDPETIYRFMRENPFAIIVSEEDGKMIATHLPVELEELPGGEKVIRTHMAKQNPQWKYFSPEKEILIIFNGPHTYISSSWYDHVNVPTWNYIAVHVYGKPVILDDTAAVGVLERLVKRYEQFSEHPFSMDQLSKEYLDNHLKALVAFEIGISRIEAKEKLSQNRTEENNARIISQLHRRDDDHSLAIAVEMERLKGSKRKTNKKN